MSATLFDTIRMSGRYVRCSCLDTPSVSGSCPCLKGPGSGSIWLARARPAFVLAWALFCDLIGGASFLRLFSQDFWRKLLRRIPLRLLDVLPASPSA